MKFSCDSSTLQKGISIVEKAISPRTSLPVLENIFLELKEGQLKLRGNDLEIGIENIVPVSGSGDDGSILIKARTISSIISKLQNQALNFEVGTDNKMIIKAEKVDFDILCTQSEDYPVFPSVEQGTKLQVPIGALKDLIKHTVFSVAFDETKQFLNGILIKNESGKLVFVTTDGYRLSLKKHETSIPEEAFSVIVPYKAMNELNKIIGHIEEDKVVAITISENQISFSIGDFLLVSRVIKGQFPDYNQVLPKELEFSYSIPRKVFVDAAERASIIASASNNVVRLSFDEGTIVLRASAPSLGEFREEMDVTKSRGEGEVKIAFNVKLILDAVKILESDDVTLEFNSGLSPCVIRSRSDVDFTYIIMPIRTSDYSEN